jgi:hypothetical protein
VAASDAPGCDIGVIHADRRRSHLCRRNADYRRGYLMKASRPTKYDLIFSLVVVVMIVMLAGINQ